jgi:hypothetical protein
MNKINNDQAQEPHKDVQYRENDESFNSIVYENIHPI